MRIITKDHRLVARGYVEFFSIDPDGTTKVILRDSNTIQFEGYDALAKIMSGAVSGHVSAMYFKFDSTGAAGTEAPAGRASTSSEFRNLTSPFDFVRVQMSNGALSNTTNSYVSNQSTFTGIAHTGAKGEVSSLTMSDTSVVTKAALVVAPSWSDKTQDLVYAVYAPLTPIAPPIGSSIGLRWAIRFAAEGV